MTSDDLYNRYRSRLEDFWGRQSNDLRFSRQIHIFGCPVELFSNEEQVLKAVDFSAALYSRAAHQEQPSFNLRFIVRASQEDPGPPPEDVFDHITYTGVEDWVHLGFGLWGSVFADLQAGKAAAVISPQLAARPDLVSRGLLNTLINNYLTRNGYAMLHATGLVGANGVLLLVAPHNSGKSTTALRLALSGKFRMLSDSQVYIARAGQGLQLTGFPVGRGKLRRDMLPDFPNLRPLLTPELVRDETKYVVDLRQLDPALVVEEAIFPSQIDLCLLTPTGRPDSALRPASPEEAWDALMQNSLHYDYPDIWAENLSLIALLLERARLYHLEIGTDGAGIVEKLLALGDQVSAS